MYRYFLGAFGNKSFIRPQYEIMEDGKLRGIEDRWGEFPNGGTVSLTGISDSDTESIKIDYYNLRLILIEIYIRGMHLILIIVINIRFLSMQ